MKSAPTPDLHADLRSAMELPAPVAERAPEAGVLPPDIASELLPPINLDLPGVDASVTEQRFDIRVRQAPARDFFLSLVEGTPYNMLVHPEVEGRITLDLKNVTIPEVMIAVRDAYGFEFETIPNGFRVLPDRVIGRVFEIDYLAMTRDGASNMHASPGELSGTAGVGRDGARGSFSSVATESRSNFWELLAGNLRQIVGEGEGRAVAVNPQAGIVLVRAMPAELREVDAYLRATQGIAHRQVILEARILEVELADRFQSGINWAALLDNNGDTAVLGQFGGGTLLDSAGSPLAGSNVLDPNALGLVRSQVATGFGGMFGMALDFSDFTAFIELLATQGNVQVLSNPRVSTMNNQKAVIKVGADEFFVTDVSSQVTTGAATTRDVNVEITPFFSGVALDVTPQISSVGDVILHVRPSVSEVTEQLKNIGTSVGAALTVPLARSTIRESDSIVRARDGQIVVIGGLMQTRSEDRVASVPVLGSIPVLGALFRHTSRVNRKSELVILLRPVVTDDRVWEREMNRASESIGRFGRPPAEAH